MPETPISLLERLRLRPDEASWQRLVALYTPLIHAWLRHHGIMNSDSDDLTQEVMQVLVRELPNFRHDLRPGAFCRWLRNVTVNRLRIFWRERHPRPLAIGQSVQQLGMSFEPTSTHRKEQMMRTYFYTAVGTVMVFTLTLTLAAAQKAGKDKSIEMTAEKLGQEDLDKGESALDDKYKGKKMRISGKVESVAENYVYLGTGLKHKQGQPVQIVMIFPEKADAQKLKAGTKVVIEGRYELAGVLGPSFKQCRLVKKQ